MTEDTKPMAMDEQTEPVDAALPKPAKDADGTPYCRVHHCRMKATTSGPRGSRKTYYQCPVKTCKESGVKIRAVYQMPSQPQRCPKCERRGKEVYAERVDRLSKNGRVQLQCPVCQWMAPAVADPRLIVHRTKRGVEQYGER